ncbi:MAG TPA: metalloregulator ArsR/SmtB family transcription factor [Aldersonia sp.]
MPRRDDDVFKALADPTRRLLLDRLRERNGQSLGELCTGVSMARQSATQHLAVLEAANLINTVRRGREKLHYLNPVPIDEIAQRWIGRFETPRLAALRRVKRTAEDTEDTMSDIPTYVYVTHIESTPERVWDALTDADLTAQYWGHANVSDWQPGSRWQHVRTDGSQVADVVGTVTESARPHRLVTTWAEPNDETVTSTVRFDIEPYGGIVRLTVTHENLPTEQDHADVSQGWPAVLSNLKSLLETGHVLPEQPWTMPAQVGG